MLKYIIPKKSTKSYENKIPKIKNEETQLCSLMNSLKSLSVTSVLFGSCIVGSSLFRHMFFSKGEEFLEVLKAIFWENGFWSLLIILQIFTFAFYSNFFQNLAYLLLNFSNRHKENWNMLCTGIFLTNIITFTCLSALSFYGIFIYMITPSDILKVQLSVSTIFSFSLNLTFIAIQFIHVFLKVCKHKRIKLEPYFPLLLPGFTVMLELSGNKLKEFIAEKLLLKKKLTKKKSMEMNDTFKKEEDILFLVE